LHLQVWCIPVTCATRAALTNTPSSAITAASTQNMRMCLTSNRISLRRFRNPRTNR
jgi:hypothetical protein